MPRKKVEGAIDGVPASGEADFPPFTGSALKFVGRPDYFVSGVPQSDLKVVADPQAQDEVAPDLAAELVATGLYVDKGADTKAPDVAEVIAADQGAQGEMTNG